MYKKSFIDNVQINELDINQICGRIVIGITDTDFQKLESLYGAKYSFILRADGLSQLTTYKNHTQIMIELGYSNETLYNQIIQNSKFKLGIFPEFNSIPATWENIFDILRNDYSAKVNSLFTQEIKDTLMNQTYQDIDKSIDLYKLSIDDDNYLTIEKFEKLEQATVQQCRFFLFVQTGINYLFGGKGYTMDELGNIGFKEYLMINMETSQINGFQYIDLDVNLEDLNKINQIQ